MMAVQAEELNKNLNDIGIKVTCEEEKFIVRGKIDLTEVELRCELPKAFPYVFPKIFLSKKTEQELSVLPHINNDLSLCLFDDTTDIPNFKNPIRLIEASIRKAHLVLTQGIHKENEKDFFDEFNAYWAKDANMTFFSDIEFGDKMLHLKFYIGRKGNYISCNAEACIRIAANYNDGGNKDAVNDCIYIPLKTTCYKDDICTQRNIADIMRSKSDYYQEYSHFLGSRSAKKSLVIFSQPFENKRIVSAFLHGKIQDVEGFRRGRAPLGLVMKGATGLHNIDHVNIVDISQKRLFSRGGIGEDVFDRKIGIIGCGSLGSNLAELLVGCGCNKFAFYDNQILTTENIARHVCGFSDVGLNKVDALSEKLSHHNPNVISERHSCDIHSILGSNIEMLNDNDYLILTVANAPIEYRCVKSYMNGHIKKPLVIMWVEPYAIAGHALILNKPQDVYEELFSAELTFLKSVVCHSDKYFKREAGCQSTYMPYSGLDIKAFIIAFIQFFTSEDCEHKKNYHFMWTGNIDGCDKYNVELNKGASELENYKSYIERID